MDGEGKRVRPRRRVPRLAIVLVLLLSAPLLAWGLASSWARGRVREVRARWAADGVSFEELAARYPDEPTNAAAHRVEALAAKLGINMVPKTQPPLKQVGNYSVKTDVAEYLERELSSELGVARPAPRGVFDFIDAHAAELDGLVAVLTEGDGPRWVHESNYGWDAHIANLHGHVTLQKLLAAVALHRAASGRGDDALRVLDASWTLNQSLRERPELYSRLIALAAMKFQLGTLRKVDDVPMVWDERLVSIDDRVALREALQWDVGMWMQPLPDDLVEALLTEHPPYAAPHRVVTFLTRPYWVACGADSAERTRIVVAADRALAPCVATEAELDAKVPPVAWWRTPSFFGGSFGGNALERAGRLSFDIELTRHVVRARAERVARIVTGPCPDWTFRTEVLPDGRMSVSYDGPPVADPSPAYVLPVRWVEGPAADVPNVP